MPRHAHGYQDEVVLEQEGGCPPEILHAARSPGESGIEIARLGFSGRAFAAGCAGRHTLMFQLTVAHQPVRCQIGNQSLQHVADPGNVAICPAETEFRGEVAAPMNLLLLSVPKDSLTCFAAEHGKSTIRLAARLSGCDAPLLAAARELVDEANACFSGGPSYWSELTDTLYSHLLRDDLPGEPQRERAVLGSEIMLRINRYVTAHLSEPIDIDTIADVAGKGRFHFPRIFRRSVGTSPYQYLIQLRLRHAIRMIRSAERSLAEVAMATGFVDQSHLCRWVKRIYGVSPAQFVKPPHSRSRNNRNLQDT
jgi:AraC family transcriptional regulator